MLNFAFHMSRIAFHYFRQFAIFSIFTVCQAANAAIVVTDAKIAGGHLIVSGTSDLGDLVSLDGYYSATVVNKTFTFSVVYVPASCIVSLGAPGTTTPFVRAAIANCAPVPVNPMGAWTADTRYQPNDLVERRNVQYVALVNSRPNLNEDPLYATSFWRAIPMANTTVDQTILIGPKGERGDAGRDGLKGEKGDDGLLANMVLHTIKAEIIMSPLDSSPNKDTWKVSSSGTLTVTVAKDSREPYADLLLPTAALTDPEGCTISGTVFDGDLEKKSGGFGRLRKMGDTLILPIRTVGESTYVQALILCPKPNN